MPWIKTAKIAEAFDTNRILHIFLFNSDLEPVYRGAIDDNAASAEKVKQPYLRNAILELVAGEEISTGVTKSQGCTINWPE